MLMKGGTAAPAAAAAAAARALRRAHGSRSALRARWGTTAERAVVTLCARLPRRPPPPPAAATGAAPSPRASHTAVCSLAHELLGTVPSYPRAYLPATPPAGTAAGTPGSAHGGGSSDEAGRAADDGRADGGGGHADGGGGGGPSALQILAGCTSQDLA